MLEATPGSHLGCTLEAIAPPHLSTSVRFICIMALTGDTLSKIAKEFYGNANAYNKIFEANKDQLSSPDRINVGQELKIP